MLFSSRPADKRESPGFGSRPIVSIKVRVRQLAFAAGRWLAEREDQPGSRTWLVYQILLQSDPLPGLDSSA